jgi:transposase
VSIVELATLLFPHLSGVRVDRIQLHGSAVRVEAHVDALVAGCPRCGVESRRVHSRYVRRLSDSAISGREVRIDVRVRRFFCRNGECPRRIFAEPLPGLAAPQSRRTQTAAGARAYYNTLRQRGTGHQAALRQRSNRLVGILHGCLKPAPSTTKHRLGPSATRSPLTTKNMGICRYRCV